MDRLITDFVQYPNAVDIFLYLEESLSGRLGLPSSLQFS